MAKVPHQWYPNISLGKAIEMVGKIYAQERNHPVDREVAVQHLSYSNLNGTSAKVLGALAHYGLLERAGKSETRVAQISVDILFPENPEDRLKAIKVASEKPKLFQELDGRFPDTMPSEANLKIYLMRKGFADATIGKAIKAYMGTREFVERETSGAENQFAAEDSEAENKDATEEASSEHEEQSQTASQPPRAETLPSVSSNKLRYVFPFEEGEASITIPRQLSEESLEDLKDWLDLVKRKAERAVKQKAENAAKGLSVFD